MTEFKVHSRHDTETTEEVETKDGRKVKSVVKTAIVELVPVTESGPTRTLHVRIETDDDLKAADIFQVGNVVREGVYTLVK